MSAKKWFCSILAIAMMVCLCSCVANPDNVTNDDTLTDEQLLALCKSKVESAQQIESWFKLGVTDYTSTLSAGTTATLLNGQSCMLKYEYYPLTDEFPLSGAKPNDQVITADMLKQQIESVYTVEFANEYYYGSSNWVVYEGDVYHVAASGVIPEPVDPDTIEDIQQENDTITFRIKVLTNDTQRELTLKNVDGNWKFNELV